MAVTTQTSSSSTDVSHEACYSYAHRYGVPDSSS